MESVRTQKEMDATSRSFDYKMERLKVRLDMMILKNKWLEIKHDGLYK